MPHSDENVYHELFLLFDSQRREISNHPLIIDVLDRIRFALPVPVEYLNGLLKMMSSKSDRDDTFLKRVIRVAETLQANGKWDPAHARMLLEEYRTTQ